MTPFNYARPYIHRLPRQILTPNKDGGAAGSAPNLEVMLKDSYPVRGLGPDGRPTRQTLARLGLNDLSAKLYSGATS